MTLISAPAGFGKTTLVSEWLNQKKEGREGKDEKSDIHPSSFIPHPSRVAWLSLDKADNDLTRFLTYLVAALQTMAPDLGDGVLGLLHSPQPPPIETILTTLLNEMTTIPDKFFLVLDDYHLIETPAVDQALTFLLDHLPPQMHLVIATREDPPLPLARLRVRGQLTELRAADLRFTPTEAADFLNQVMDLNLSAEEISTLEARTEGWIAGLQMAALSMQGRADTAGFIQAFSGGHRFVLDYLVEEVLHQQPESVQTFLLHTSILDRLCGPLCDVVVGRLEIRDWRLENDNQAADSLQSPITNLQSQETLEYLERANLLVVPLDDERRWYRYHHLFADVLQARLMKEQPGQPPILHRRASEWYEQNGLSSDAIRHALAAEDFARAADLIEMLGAAQDEVFQSATWLGWVRAIPDELLQTRPVLTVEYAWTLLGIGEVEAAEAQLRNAEWWLTPTADRVEPSAEMVVVDEEEFQFLPASIAAARTYHAQALGDLPNTIKYGRQALDLYPEDDHLRRGAPAALLGIAQWASGDLEAAYHNLTEVMAGFRQVGNIVFAMSGTYGLADIKTTQGQLHEAIRLYEQSLQLARAQGEPTPQGTTDLYLGLGELHHEQGHVDAARQYLQKSEDLGGKAALPDWSYRAHLVQARIKQSQGDLDDALHLLDEAERLYYRSPVPVVRPVAARKVRVWLKQGKLAKALAWVREHELTVEDDLTFLREFEYITLARVLIAHAKSDDADGSIQQAMGLLERLLKAAEDGGRIGSVIEILMLQAFAHEAQGDLTAALESLEQALTLAEPEGYVRIFVDEGLPMAQLLTRMKDEGGRMKEYIRKLLTVFGQQKDVQPSALNPQPLIELLSERELEVFQLIAQGLSNREISERLFLALSTVKGHNRNIYGKLQVQRRTEAVARARELGLV